MGSKTAARRAARAAGVSVVPGTEEPLGADVADSTIVDRARDIGFPVMVKAVAGGGGKGMRVVHGAADLPSAIRAARSEAGAAFGDSAIYLERRLERPRHIEVQLLADHHGTVLPFVERECSIQRRHQKVIEETPSPVVSPEQRTVLTAAAAAVAASVGYVNAGTVEFLLDGDGRFYFLEMNTRIQVEHPVTEMITGVDLVQWQIRIARGERLTLSPEPLVKPTGHAIECRVYAEDPDAGFLPSPGRITSLRVPSGPGIRDDGWAETGTDVPIFYDPLISKLIAWGEDRPQAIARMRRALMEYEIRGIRTSLPFFHWMLRQPAFLEAQFHTEFLDELLQRRGDEGFSDIDPSLEEVAAIAACVADAVVRGRVCSRRRPAGPDGNVPGPAPDGPRSNVEGSGATRGPARMTCEVEIRGRRRTIEVRRTGPDWELTLDGRILGVNVTAIGERWSLLIGPPEGGPDVSAWRPPTAGAGFRRPTRSYEVAVDRAIERRADRPRERPWPCRCRSSIRGRV